MNRRDDEIKWREREIDRLKTESYFTSGLRRAWLAYEIGLLRKESDATISSGDETR